MKKIKDCIKYILIFFITMIILSTLLVISFMLPDDNIRNNIYESLPTLLKETNYFRPFFEKEDNLSAYSALDNFTDAIILNVASDRGKEQNINVVQRAFSSIYFKYNNNNQCKNLKDSFDEKNTPNSTYTRYWFGIESILRFLLLIFNLSEIRYINMIFIFLLFLIAFYLIAKKIHIKYAFAFAISIILMNFFVIPMSLQYSPVMIITLIETIIILTKYNEEFIKKKAIPMFIIFGAITAYMDLLTYPLITLGIPLIIIMLLDLKQNKYSLKQELKLILKLSIAWGLSYAMLHILKWIITSIILNENVINIAVDQLKYRLNIDGNTHFNKMTVIQTNVDIYFSKYVKVLLIIYTFIWVITMIFAKNKNLKYKNLIPILIIGMYPIIWYCILTNHSIEHHWMTYKILSITMFSFLNVTLYMIDESKLKLKNIIKSIDIEK